MEREKEIKRQRGRRGVRGRTRGLVTSHIDIFLFPRVAYRPHEMSSTEFVNKSCRTINGRLRDVSQTERERSRLPMAQQVTFSDLSFPFDLLIVLESIKGLNLK